MTWARRRPTAIWADERVRAGLIEDLDLHLANPGSQQVRFDGRHEPFGGDGQTFQIGLVAPAHHAASKGNRPLEA